MPITNNWSVAETFYGDLSKKGDLKIIHVIDKDGKPQRGEVWQKITVLPELPANYPLKSLADDIELQFYKDPNYVNVYHHKTIATTFETLPKTISESSIQVWELIMRDGRYSAMMSSETRTTHTSHAYLIAIVTFFLTTTLICAINVHVRKHRLLRFYPYLLFTLLYPLLLLYPNNGELHGIILAGSAFCLIFVAIGCFVSTLDEDIVSGLRGYAIIFLVLLTMINVGALMLCSIYVETPQTARQHVIAVATVITLAIIIRFVYATALKFFERRKTQTA
jgi:hypothetical protein